MPRRIQLATLCLLAMLAGALSGATFTVTNLSDAGAGSLRQAIIDTEATAPSDAIVFQSGLSGTITLASALPAIGGTLIIQGGYQITINGAASFQLFNVIGGDLTLVGLVLEDGVSGAEGGAIYLGAGGGQLDFSMADCEIRNCVAGDGGALCTFTISPGVVFATIDRCAFTGNTASFSGGAIAFVGDITSMQITNCTFSGNSAGLQGGAVAVAASADVAFTHCTLTDNQAASGGALYRSSGTCTLYNSIVAENNGPAGSPDCSGSIVSADFNLIGNVTGMTITAQSGDQFGTAGSPIDPMLVALANNGGPTPTHALLNSSPAVDAGDSSMPPASDQRGYSRVDTPDCGAFELQPPQIDVGQGGSITAGSLQLLAGASAPGVARDEVFTLDNFNMAGEKNLTLDAPPVVFAGFGNCTATVTTAPQSTIVPGGSTSFTLSITPTAQGLYWCEFLVLSDDPFTPSFSITLVGAADAPSGGGGGGSDEASCSTSDARALTLPALIGLMAAAALARRRRKVASTSSR